ncbi:hypothetical protein [Paenibacillus glycanilyticus]|uniref:DUF4367 domain-containing protein n=1 Tax=Paenibacillus glycanilyticus TaxID=126569 RepID=A0ABQ6GAT9_9BACL|nr:hypothetical protein [Paenibacillus glycanilyticus]GLX68054.1 hypothetical protein MU1_23990 [Paenibacillus glycanilyticus]
MNKFGLVCFTAIVLLLSGCQGKSSNDELSKAEKNVDQLAASFKISKLDGYEVSSVQHTFPPKDKEGNFIGNNQEVLITYTDHIGKLEKVTKEQQTSDEREFLYGPYQGESVIEITHSNMQNNLDGAEMIEISGTQVQKVISSEHTFEVFNVANGSITMNFNGMDEDRIQSIAQQIINENN